MPEPCRTKYIPHAGALRDTPHHFLESAGLEYIDAWDSACRVQWFAGKYDGGLGSTSFSAQRVD